MNRLVILETIKFHKIMWRLLLGCLFLSSFIGRAQLFDTNHLVDTNVGSLYGVKTGDFDNDGDPDLLTITSQELVWYENLDGQGNFGSAINIDSNTGQSLQSFKQTVVDLDQDGWDDILISYFSQDLIAYYRNLGNNTFAPFQTLASNLNEVAGMTPGDCDGDGDLDLVLGVSNNSGLYWLEHLDGNGSFGPLQSIRTSISSARNQAIGDIDGDGDLDFLSNSSGAVIMSWFENVNGQGDFSLRHIIDNSGASYENTFQLADIDGDGDLDNLTARFDEILWRENLDGQGTFGSNRTIFLSTDSSISFNYVVAVDIDNDGDLDVTYDIGIGYGKVYHLNTDGMGNFGPPNYIPPQIGDRSFLNHAMDMDSDGDMDLICGNYDFATNIANIYWYENLTILSTDTFSMQGLKLYPNPVKETLIIESPIEIQKVNIYTFLGKKVLEVTQNVNEISLSGLPSGSLLLKLETEKGNIIEKIVKE